MSIKAMEAAVKANAPSHTAKLVMMIMAYHHNGETGRCFPSYERMAQEAQLAKTSVIKAVKELEAAGLVRKIKAKRAGTFNASNHYVLVFMQADALFSDRVRHHGYARRAGSAALPKQEAPSSPLRSEEGPKPKKKRSHRAKPRFRMDPDWKPKPKDLVFAKEAGFDDDAIAAIAFDFREYWIAQGKTAADWSAAFRRWVAKQVKFNKETPDVRARTGTGGRFPDRVDRIRSFDDAIRQGSHECGQRGGLPGDGEDEPEAAPRRLGGRRDGEADDGPA